MCIVMPYKRNLDDYAVSFELDAEQRDTLERLSNQNELLHLPPTLKCLVPMIESIRKACSNTKLPYQGAPSTRQATDFKRTIEAARTLGVDYKADDTEYIFRLSDENLQVQSQLSEHFAHVIKDIKSSENISTRADESFSRTILDLIVIDRLRQLEDKDAFRRLQIAAEVPVSVKVKDTYGNDQIIKGRADWVLGYGATKSETGAILLVIEAKPHHHAGVGMPQLLVYMAAVYEARKEQLKTNKGVFGMVSDSETFQFSFLDENKRLFISAPLLWITDKSKIITYIDMAILSAIESSPHTTPQKHGNQATRNFPTHLRKGWQFGDERDQDDDESGNHDPVIVEVTNVDGRIIMTAIRPDAEGSEDELKTRIGEAWDGHYQGT